MNDRPGPARNIKVALWRGARGRCPACGAGAMFASFLKVAPECRACGEGLHHQRADDFPAYIVIFIVGHIVVGAAAYVALHSDWPVWIHMLLWPLWAAILAVALLQPVKGAVVGLQWALRMHGFAGEDASSRSARNGEEP
jgi:uncharacterized protein (DUF983 family)